MYNMNIKFLCCQTKLFEFTMPYQTIYFLGHNEKRENGKTGNNRTDEP